MASEKQLAANRRNAQKSTGPRTEAGKQSSRRNAMKSGLYAESLVIRGEFPDELERLTAEYHREFRPVTPRERDLVDAIVRNEWIVRRMGLVEAQLWGHHFQATAATLPASRFEALDRRWPVGHAFESLSLPLERLQRRVSAVERSTRRALQELAELRERRQSAADEQREPADGTEDFAFTPDTAGPEPEPAPQPFDPESGSGRIGFVPSHSAEAAEAVPEPQAPGPQSSIPDPQPPAPALALSA